MVSKKLHHIPSGVADVRSRHRRRYRFWDSSIRPLGSDLDGDGITLVDETEAVPVAEMQDQDVAVVRRWQISHRVPRPKVFGYADPPSF